MPKVVDIVKKAEELRSVLQKYNGLPSCNEDRAARSLIMYYIKKHAEIPEIKALIEDFSLESSAVPQRGYDVRLKEILSILEEHECIPEFISFPVEYQAVLFFFSHYKDVEEVQRLKYLYADSDSFPLSDKEFRKKHAVRFHNKIRDDRLYGIRLSCEYVTFVYKKYGELPKAKTIPMKLILSTSAYRRKMNNRLISETISHFVNEMLELGCNEPYILSVKKNIEPYIR